MANIKHEDMTKCGVRDKDVMNGGHFQFYRGKIDRLIIETMSEVENRWEDAGSH